MMNNKIALTIDIEDWYHTPAITGSNFSIYPDVPAFMSSWNENYDYLSEPTSNLLEILDKYELKATFFIVADIVDYYPGLVENINRRGHEIGCHGLHHAAKINSKTKQPRFTVDEFEERTAKARKILQDVTGQPVNGYRAPGAYIGEWMFESLIKLEFKYDSSVNPNSFFNKTNFSTDEISSEPYWIYSKKNNNKILEIPWPYWRIGPLRFPTAGGPFLRLLGKNYISRGLKQSLKRGNTVFYSHSIDLSEKIFPDVIHTKTRPFYWLIKGTKTADDFKKILNYFKNYWSICSDILKKYNASENNI